MPMMLRYRPVLLLCALMACAQVGWAQVDSGNEIPEVTRTYALVGATVVQAPGRVLERATVIIRDGLITAVGRDIPIPFDAEQVAADSFTVYSGFIDGLSHAGIPVPKEQPRAERPDDPGFPSDIEAGILPGLDVRTLLKADDKSLADLRKAGFTAAHVVPRGRMLPGSGAIILLAGDDIHELVYSGETSLFAQLASARRMYPGTDMAVIAKMRQLFQEARRRQRIEQLYAEDPTGISRPEYDPTHYALFPVIDGNRTVYFHTEDVLDVHRALALQEELGFSMVLTGFSGSFDAVDKLKDAQIPLLLTLDLPEDKRKQNDSQSADIDSTEAQPTDIAGGLPEVATPAYDPLLRVQDLNDLEEEKRNLEARRDAERKAYLESAGALASAGMAFGFTTLDTKASDVLPNVRTYVENGLSEDVALAALTTSPARILGVAATMGTIDVGKVGNLVVATGNIFDKDTEIRYVFVDGRKFEMEAAQRGARTSDAEADSAVGTWSFTASTPDGDVVGTMVVNNDLSGTISMDVMEITFTDATFEDDVLSFSAATAEIGTISVTVTITGDEFEGVASSEVAGSIPFSGQRVNDP